LKIKYRILLFVFLPSFIIFFSLATFFLWKENNKDVLIFQQRITKISNLAVNTLKKSLVNNDEELSISNATVFFSDDTIHQLILFNCEDKVIFNKKKKQPYKKNDIIVHRLLVKDSDKILGKIIIEYNKKQINDNYKKLKSQVFTFIFIIFLTLFISMIFISKIIYTPIDKLISSFKKIELGEYTHRIDFSKNHDFKIVEEYFNNMIENLEKTFYENKKFINDIHEKNSEIESTYNQIIGINELLSNTLTTLEISENKYKNIFNYSPDTMLIVNLETKKIEEYNNDFINIIKERNINISNLYLDNIFSKNDIDKIFVNIGRKELLHNFETYLELLNIDVIISVIPLKHDFLHVQIVIKNITEIKILQKKLETYAKELEIKVNERTKEIILANKKIKEQQEKLIDEAYNRGLVEVTAGIIHNIGNIVNIIDLNLEEIIDESPGVDLVSNFLENIIQKELELIDEKDKHSIKVIKAIPKLNNIISEIKNTTINNFIFLRKKVSHLKDIVQLQKNFIGSLGTEDYNNINYIIEDVIDIYSSSIEKRDININFIKNDLPLVLCDKAQIFQVISNFIKNSYEALQDSDVNNKIVNIKTKHDEKNIEIIIKDNGTGIKLENIDKIFNFGFTTKKGNSGSGIGLHNSKHIIKKYGGVIEVVSDYKSYTEFKIYLPYKKEISK